MRTPSLRAAWLLWCLLMPAQLFADDEPRDETTRWVPSLGAWSSVLVQSADGEASSSDVSFNRTVRTRVFNPTPPAGFVEQIAIQNLTTPVRPSVSDDDRLVTATIVGTLELMTPGFQQIPGRPRFFVIERGEAARAQAAA